MEVSLSSLELTCSLVLSLLAATSIQDLCNAAEVAGISVMLGSGIKHPEQVQDQKTGTQSLLKRE